MEQEAGNGWSEGVHPDDLKALRYYVSAFDATPRISDGIRLRRHDGELPLDRGLRGSAA